MGKCKMWDGNIRDSLEYVRKKYNYDVVFIGLFGSQNYGLDDTTSDIDCVCVVMPSLNEVISSEPVSKTLNYEDGNGQIKLMDIRNFAKQLKSGSFVNLEALFSDYCIVDKKFDTFYSARENIYFTYKSAFKIAICGAVYSIRKKYLNAEEDRKPKLLYEALRLVELYKQILDNPEKVPNFYISDLKVRSNIGLVKCGEKVYSYDDVLEATKICDMNLCKNDCSDNYYVTALAESIVRRNIVDAIKSNF